MGLAVWGLFGHVGDFLVVGHGSKDQLDSNFEAASS